jgi:hypothetical protein
MAHTDRAKARIGLEDNYATGALRRAPVAAFLVDGENAPGARGLSALAV